MGNQYLRVLGRSAGLFLMLALSLPTFAMWIAPDDTVPVERLLANLQKQLEKNPGSHSVLTQIARVHSRAYFLAEQNTEISYEGPHVPPGEKRPDDAPMRLYEAGTTGFGSPREGAQKVSEAQVAHLKSAIEFYRKATAHKDATPYDWLGLGFNLHEASRIPERMTEPGAAPKDDTARATAIRKLEDDALDAYFKCFEYKEPEDREVHFDSRSELQMESGDGIVEIMSRRTDLDKEGQRRLKATRRKVAELRATQQHWITPIVLHLSERRELRELLAPERLVNFDLDGSGRGDTWSWVQPDTALLVWDEDGRGDVPSGRELFGSVTWWIFWHNGYEALKSLDNDNNGWLEDRELNGVAVWRDQNSNGVSDPGEVQPVSDVGVAGISVSATCEVDGMPANAQGLRMQGGAILPTYDWITQPVKSAAR